MSSKQNFRDERTSLFFTGPRTVEIRRHLFDMAALESEMIEVGAADGQGFRGF